VDNAWRLHCAPHHKAALRGEEFVEQAKLAYVNPIWVLLANLIVGCCEEQFKKVRMLRRTNSDSEHVRMLAALDRISRRPQNGASHGYGRDELSRYHRSLLSAVEVWRRLVVWRVRTSA
jgi:hypothetical protein